MIQGMDGAADSGTVSSGATTSNGVTVASGDYKPGQITLVGWLIFLFGMYMINRSKTGHTLIFWSLTVIAIFLLVGNYKRIMPIIRKGG